MQKRPFAVLLVDDDPDDRFVFGEALKGLPFWIDYIPFEDGLELIEYLTHQKNGDSEAIMLFLDLNMPKVSGFEILKGLKSNGWEEGPIIIWTTSDDPKDKEECLRLGAKQFVTKPASFEETVQVLKRIIHFPSSGLNLLTRSCR